MNGNGHLARLALGATQRGKTALARQLAEAMRLLDEAAGAAAWTEAERGGVGGCVPRAEG